MQTMPSHPTKEELLAAKSKTVPDVIAPNLRILFCGINPGLYTAWVGHHFGRPGNRFWPAMYAGGLTPRLFDPREDGELLQYGLGITNLVSRATVRADELSVEELQQGKAVLAEKVTRYQPQFLAVLGIDSYRKAFRLKNVHIGLQPNQIGTTRIWVLPNPSGLNAHFTPSRLQLVFADLRKAAFG